jgi:hypothetical protein
MRSLRDSFRSFKEGLQPKLLWDYWLAFKSTAWELFYGATLIGIPFAVYTLLYAPSKVLLLSYLLLVVFVAGYYLWRADHIRLMPKLEARDFKVVRTPTTDANETRVYVQVLPKCLTEAPVSKCKGRLLRVYKCEDETKQWELTAMDEPVDLEWSIHGFNELTIQRGSEPRLNVCFIALSMYRKRLRQIVPTISPNLLRWVDVFDCDGIFKFDIKITAENCAPVDVFLTVSMPSDHASNDPMVTLL